MAEIIGFIAFLLCITAWIFFSSKGITSKKNIKKNDLHSLEKQEEVDARIRKIEDVYGEKAILIMFQELSIPNICELLVILEEAQIILILGEAYNFSEILNLKVDKTDYIRLKHTIKNGVPSNFLEKTASGYYAAKTIRKALQLLEETQEPISSPSSQTVKVDIMTGRLEEPILSLSPSSHSVDEVIVALSMIIDSNEKKWATVERKPDNSTTQKVLEGMKG